MKPMKFGIGQPVKRVEDAKFITGFGQYTADVEPVGTLHAVLVRSPHARATFKIADTAPVAAQAGVKLVLTAADIADLGGLPCLAPVDNTDGSMMKQPAYPVLARETVRHVGDAVAMVVADTMELAREAAEAIEVEYEALPAVVEVVGAIAPDAPSVWAEQPTNIAYDKELGDKAKTDAIFASAAKVVSLTVVNNRLVANYLEPRAALGEFDAKAARYTLTTSSQGVHGLRASLSEQILKIPPEQLRVVTPDVGGGFGTKAIVYREYPLLLVAAKRTGRPVKWVADRSEHFLGDAQGRDNYTTASMALDKDGRFLAMRVDILGNLGSYLSQFGPFIPWLGATMATGTYDIPVVHARCRGIYTNTVPVDAYRGAGRPEAAYVLERLVDTCARETGLPREELRARNFVKSSQMPYKTQTDRTYDVGDFEGAMREALSQADYAGFPARAEEANKRGAVRGIGFSSYIECTAWGDGEEGSVALEPDGTFTVLVGTQSNGQGHATAYAQTVSQYLDVPLDRVRVVQGDTDRVKTGHGTGGSRSIPIGAAMVSRASDTLARKLTELAAEELEAAVGDVEIADGGVRVVGTDRALSYEQMAKLPGATEQIRTATEEFTPPQATYPNGTHVCEVEVDPQTGVVAVQRYTICDDFGMTLNPLLLAGQVHGGVVQGIGQALLEHTIYGSDGQLITASLMDYCLPRAGDAPFINFKTRNIPSTTNPLGLKGAGEAGTIGACPAVMNAVVDALHRARGVTHVDMPATPSRVYAALNGAAPNGGAIA